MTIDRVALTRPYLPTGDKLASLLLIGPRRLLEAGYAGVAFQQFPNQLAVAHPVVSRAGSTFGRILVTTSGSTSATRAMMPMTV